MGGLIGYYGRAVAKSPAPCQTIVAAPQDCPPYNPENLFRASRSFRWRLHSGSHDREPPRARHHYALRSLVRWKPTPPMVLRSGTPMVRSLDGQYDLPMYQRFVAVSAADQFHWPKGELDSHRSSKDQTRLRKARHQRARSERCSVTSRVECARAQRLFPGICRICFGETTEPQLVAPCGCLGDRQFVHPLCLVRLAAAGPPA